MNILLNCHNIRQPYDHETDRYCLTEYILLIRIDSCWSFCNLYFKNHLNAFHESLLDNTLLIPPLAEKSLFIQ